MTAGPQGIRGRDGSVESGQLQGHRERRRQRVDDLESVERAIVALEAQRDLLGTAVVDTALTPLRERRAPP